MLRQSTVVFAGSAVVAACGFLFQMIASRRLGVDEYGLFYTLISLVMVAAIPGAILAPVVARYAAEFRALHDDAHVHGLMLDVVRWTVLGAIIYIAAAGAVAVPVAAFLHAPAWSVPLVGAIAAVGLGSAVLRGVAQGTQAFAAYAVSVGLESAVKLGVVFALLLIGFGLRGALFGAAAGAICGLLYVALSLSRHFASAGRERVSYDWRRIARSATAAASATLAVTLIGSVDVVLVKHFFSSYEAGLYSAAALGGKVLFFAVGFVPTVLLPRVTDRFARGERTGNILWIGIGLLAVVALSCGIAMAYGGGLFLHVLVGGAFGGASALLMPYALAMVALALTNLLANYGVATHRHGFVVPICAGTILTLAAIATWHPTLGFVVRTLLAGSVLTCAASAFAIALQSRSRRPADRIFIVGPLPYADKAGNGMACFIGTLANAMASGGTHATVLAQADAHRSEDARYEQLNVWQSDRHPFRDILRTLVAHRATNVNVHHEMFLYGRLRVNLSFLAFLFAARLLGMRVVTTMHHALRPSDLRHLLGSGEYAPAWLCSLLVPLGVLFNGAVALLSANVAVHSRRSVEAFPAGYMRQRVRVVPLIVGEPKTKPESAA
jgi:O-antigen/teichoic acid export membrane protein